MALYDWTYTNFHDLNLRWIIKKVKENEDYIKTLPEEIRKIILELFNEGLIDADAGTGLRSSQPTRECLMRVDGLRNISGDSNYVTLQGGCYDSKRNCYVLAFTDNVSDNALLVQLDSTFNVTNVSLPLSLGHANDLTYNKDNDRIYVATGNTGTYAGKVVVIDPTTLTYVSDFALATMPEVWFLSYDEDNKLYYADGYGALNVYDSSFNLTKSISRTYTYKGEGTLIQQCSFVYKGNYILVSLSTLHTDFDTVYFSYINDAGVIDTFAKYAPFDAKDELENICVIDGALIGFHGQQQFRISRYDITGKYYIPLKLADSFLASERIAPSGDLDNFLIAGVYNVPSATIAQTLSNIPEAIGGTLFVEPQTETFIRQRYITTGGVEYIRYYNSSDQQFRAWQLQLYTQNNTYMGLNSKIIMLRNGTTYDFSIPKGCFKLFISKVTYNVPSGSNYAEYLVSSPSGSGSSNVYMFTLQSDAMVTSLTNNGSDSTATKLRIVMADNSAYNIIAQSVTDTITKTENATVI